LDNDNCTIVVDGIKGENQHPKGVFDDGGINQNTPNQQLRHGMDD
jgi:hypothetical protein